MSRFRLIKPYVQEGLRCFAIMSAGDVIAQTVVEKKRLTELDFTRNLKFGMLGLVFVGPTLKFWYGSMEKLVAMNQKPFKRALKKMAMDQLLFAPVFTATIMSMIAATNLETKEQIKTRLYNDYTRVMLSNYMLWPAAQIFNFSCVPLGYQVVFAQIVAVFWNCYMSLVLNKTKEDITKNKM